MLFPGLDSPSCLNGVFVLHELPSLSGLSSERSMGSLSGMSDPSYLSSLINVNCVI